MFSEKSWYKWMELGHPCKSIHSLSLVVWIIIQVISFALLVKPDVFITRVLRDARIHIVPCQSQFLVTWRERSRPMWIRIITTYSYLFGTWRRHAAVLTLLASRPDRLHGWWIVVRYILSTARKFSSMTIGTLISCILGNPNTGAILVCRPRRLIDCQWKKIFELNLTHPK